MVIIIAVIGVWTTVFGAWLAVLGGSLYYAIAGIGLIVSAVLLYRGSAAALWVYALVLAGTLIWALFEVGLDFWQLSPRGNLLVPIAVALLLPWLTRWLRPGTSAIRGAGIALSVALVASIVVLVIALFQNPNDTRGTLRMAEGGAPPATYAALGDWPAYGGTWDGLKWSPLTQITPANVNKLEPAWHIHTGDLKQPDDPGEFTYEMTPIKVGNLLYLCTPHDIVIAVDPVTGKQVWRYDPKVKVEGTQHMTCRGVSYYDSAATPGAPPQPPRAADCSTRIFLATNDSRLIALDALSGKRCGGFGNAGEIGLIPQYPRYKEGWYQFTSAPLVTRGLVVLAGAIFDNRDVKMPSGVVRAFDAKTGKLVWNFDPGNPGRTAPLAPGQHYSLSSPNSWSTSAADEKLGMIYLPFGMGAVDQYGGTRPPTTEKFASSIVALDTETGQLKWVFQTVHHDLWDMDVPAQPALVDLPINGTMVPALVQSTKTGNIFILDRRTGKPVLPVVEKPVPQGAAPGDWTAKTQPFSQASFMPQKFVTGADMWGATMLDQLMCRVAFQGMRYDGPFTPPSTKGSLVYPGNFGVMDWGGMAIDPVRKVAFANPSYMAFVDKLTTKRPADMQKQETNRGLNPNYGAPYAVYLNPFLSELGLPCQAPPWGYVAGMDLTTGKVAWMHKNGTIRDSSPVPLPFKLGVPSLGGPMVTAGGVGFLSATLDNYVRAYDLTTGNQLWEARLPAGGQATPMSYQGADGRQYVVVVAGGHGTLGTTPGDDVIAYALPKRS
jgi:quinoprotein glucose dehydrogenase